jgi:hypothetical protein
LEWQCQRGFLPTTRRDKKAGQCQIMDNKPAAQVLNVLWPEIPVNGKAKITGQEFPAAAPKGINLFRLAA